MTNFGDTYKPIPRPAGASTKYWAKWEAIRKSLYAAEATADRNTRRADSSRSSRALRERLHATIPRTDIIDDPLYWQEFRAVYVAHLPFVKGWPENFRDKAGMPVIRRFAQNHNKSKSQHRIKRSGLIAPLRVVPDVTRDGMARRVAVRLPSDRAHAEYLISRAEMAAAFVDGTPPTREMLAEAQMDFSRWHGLARDGMRAGRWTREQKYKWALRVCELEQKDFVNRGYQEGIGFQLHQLKSWLNGALSDSSKVARRIERLIEILLSPPVEISDPTTGNVSLAPVRNELKRPAGVSPEGVLRSDGNWYVWVGVWRPSGQAVSGTPVLLLPAA